jgi:hypothetical protein
MHALSEWQGSDPATGFHLVKTSAGRALRIADLVDDDPSKRDYPGVDTIRMKPHSKAAHGYASVRKSGISRTTAARSVTAPPRSP